MPSYKNTYIDGYGVERKNMSPIESAINTVKQFFTNSKKNYKDLVDTPGLGWLYPSSKVDVALMAAGPLLKAPKVITNALKTIRVNSTKNLPKTYVEAVSEYDKLVDILRKRGKLSKQEDSRLDFLRNVLVDVKDAAQDVATERTERAWKAFDKKLEAAEKSPKPEMIWSDFEQANIPSYYLWEKPERTLPNPEEMWELMYKNTEMGERAAAAKRESEKIKQLNKKAKDADNYSKWAADPEATLNYSAGFFKDGFHYKQGGIIKRK